MHRNSCWDVHADYCHNNSEINKKLLNTKENKHIEMIWEYYAPTCKENEMIGQEEMQIQARMRR